MDEYDKRVTKAILGEGQPLPPDDIEAELNLVTAADYDNWVTGALYDRIAARIQVDPDSVRAEHPTARVFRIGIESIRAGKPSEAFLTVLEEIAERATRDDVLHLIFRETFPKPIVERTMTAAEDGATIVAEFREYLRSPAAKNKSYADLKKKFKINMLGRLHDKKQVDRALAAYDIDFPARPGSFERAK